MSSYLWALIAGILFLSFSNSSLAQTDSDLCRIVEGIKDGGTLIQETSSQWRIASRRPVGEVARAGFSSVKGTLAQHITKGQPGLSVKWARAEERGPIKCGTYSAILVLVEASTVLINPSNQNALEGNEAELEELVLKRMSGKATRDELLRLRQYFVQVGDLVQAKQLLDQVTQTIQPN